MSSAVIARRWPSFVGAVLFALLVYVCLPDAVIAIDDDFGYLRSVVETLQRGRPWTDDWLAPWSASFSLACAGLYSLTGGFYLATYGFLAVLAGATFWFCSRLLADRSNLAPVIALLGLTFPPIFWKLIQFTGVAFYVPCLFGAIWAWQGRRWILFFLFWALALGTRQSAIVWIALPAVTALGEWRREKTSLRSRVIWVPALVAILGVGWFGLMSGIMNETFVQRTETSRILEHLAWPTASRALALSAVVFSVMSGIGSWIANFGRPGRALHGWPVRVTLMAVAVGSCFIDVRPYFYSDETIFAGTLGLVCSKALVAAGVLGWSWRNAGWRRPVIAAAATSAALIAVRGIPWEYYFVDIATFALFSRDADASPNPSQGSLRSLLLASPVLLALGAASFLFVIQFKSRIDQATGLCLAAEKTMRSGQLQADELGFCPLGFVAWQLLPYYLAHDVGQYGIGDFGLYLRSENIQVGQHISRSLRRFPEFNRIAPSDRHNLIGMEKVRFLWLYETEFYLLRAKPATDSPGKLTLGPDFHREPFPLNDAEWTALIEKKPSR